MHRRLVRAPHRDRVAALHAVEFALRALEAILQPGECRGIGDLRGLVAGTGGFDRVDHRVVQRDPRRQAGFDLVRELERHAVAIGAARIAREHRVVALGDRVGGHLQPCLRRERHVVLRELRRLAVPADIGAADRQPFLGKAAADGPQDPRDQTRGDQCHQQQAEETGLQRERLHDRRAHPVEEVRQAEDRRVGLVVDVGHVPCVLLDRLKGSAPARVVTVAAICGSRWRTMSTRRSYFTLLAPTRVRKSVGLKGFGR